MAILFLLAIGCSDPLNKESESSGPGKTLSTEEAARGGAGLTGITPDNVGAIHNNTLAAIQSQFAAGGVDPSSLEEADHYAAGYELQYFNANEIDVSESIVAASYPWRNGIFPISYQKSTICTNFDITAIADQLVLQPNTSVLINDAERTIIHDLFVSLEQYKNEEIGYPAMKDRVANLKEVWNQQGFNTALHEGDVSAYTLNVADASLTYWHEYEGSDPSGRVAALPGILVADAAGALGGAIGAGLDSWWNTGKVNWKSVGSWALGGAIGASVPGLRIFKKFYAVCPQ